MAKTTTKKKVKVTKSASNQMDTWTELKEKFSDLPPEAYSIRGSFRVDTLIDHPSFGVGVVTGAHTSKIEVCFAEGIKTLIHRKEA